MNLADNLTRGLFPNRVFLKKSTSLGINYSSEELPEARFGNSPIKFKEKMTKGTISKLISDRGFGFIKPEGEDKDIFFHASELDGIDFESLKEGDQVVFEMAEGPKGANAVNVSKN